MNTTQEDQVKVLSVREEITGWERFISIQKGEKVLDIRLVWNEEEGVNAYFSSDEEENELFPDEFEGDIAFLLDELTAYFNKEKGE